MNMLAAGESEVSMVSSEAASTNKRGGESLTSGHQLFNHLGRWTNGEISR